MDALTYEFIEPTSNEMPPYDAGHTADLLACLRRIQPTGYLCPDTLVGWEFRTERNTLCDNETVPGIRHRGNRSCQNPRYAENVTFE